MRVLAFPTQRLSRTRKPRPVPPAAFDVERLHGDATWRHYATVTARSAAEAVAIVRAIAPADVRLRPASLWSRQAEAMINNTRAPGTAMVVKCQGAAA